MTELNETPCPSCKVSSGRCLSPSGKPIAIHASRIRKNRAEHYGPQPYDVVYLDDLKYRVLDKGAGDTIRLRRGTSRTIHFIERSELGYDAIAGMWRRL